MNAEKLLAKLNRNIDNAKKLKNNNQLLQTRIYSKKDFEIIKKMLSNLHTLLSYDFKPVIANKLHTPHSYKATSINMLALVNIQNKQRPFLDKFIQWIETKFKLPASAKNGKNSFNTIKLDMECKVNEAFTRMMRRNALNLKKLKYRQGIPLVRDGIMINNIHWKLVKVEK